MEFHITIYFQLISFIHIYVPSIFVAELIKE